MRTVQQGWAATGAGVLQLWISSSLLPHLPLPQEGDPQGFWNLERTWLCGVT